MHPVSSKYILYALISGKNMHKGLFFYYLRNQSNILNLVYQKETYKILLFY